MSDKQFKFSDLIPEFSRFRTNEDKTRIGCQSIDDSLFVSTRKGEKYFKPLNVVCPEYKLAASAGIFPLSAARRTAHVYGLVVAGDAGRRAVFAAARAVGRVAVFHPLCL